MARLPIVGGDSNEHGTVLNDYLNQAHNLDGTLKESAINAAATTINTAIARVDPGVAGTAGRALIQGPSSPTFADMDTVIYDHIHARSATPATNRANLQSLIDNLAPGGTGKQVRLFIPPRWANGAPDPLIVDRSGSGAWSINLPSNVTIEGAGQGSTIKLADGQANFTRMLNINGKTKVTVRNLWLDGNKGTQDPLNLHSHNLGIFGSTDVVVEDVVAVNAAGDGVYVGSAPPGCDRVLIRHLVSSGCGRNPLSVCDVSNIWIIDPDLDCASGGQAIDSEPNDGAIYSGLHILGGKVRNSGGGDYAVSLSGGSSAYPRVKTVVQGLEFAGGGISTGGVEDVIISETFGNIGKIDARHHSRRVKLLGNNWESSATGVAVEVAGAISSNVNYYPSDWTVIGNTLVAATATTGWHFWDCNDLMFGQNTTEGGASMGRTMHLRANLRNVENTVLGPNIWKTATNGIYAERTGTSVFNGMNIGPQLFRGITTRTIDFGTTDIITNLAIAAQTLTGGTSIRIGNGTPYVMTGIQGSGAVWSCFGTPEGIITERVGAVAYRRDGGAGTTMYVKESGVSTNTGWRAV